jgi:hypothetical protein
MSIKQKVFLIVFTIFCILGSFSGQKLYPFIPFNMYSEFNPLEIKIVRIKVIDNKRTQYIDFRRYISSSLSENDIYEMITKLNKKDKLKFAELSQKVKEYLQKENKEIITDARIVIGLIEQEELNKTRRTRYVELN